MLDVVHDPQWLTGRIILRPHPPSSWRINLWVVLGIGALALSIATGFAFAGAWLILPFAGLEVMLLLAALYAVSIRCQRREVLSFSESEVVFEKGRHWPVFEWRCQRYWCRLHVYTPEYSWYGSKIQLRCHGQYLELGQFLSETEKQELVRKLTAFLQYD